MTGSVWPSRLSASPWPPTGRAPTRARGLGDEGPALLRETRRVSISSAGRPWRSTMCAGGRDSAQPKPTQTKSFHLFRAASLGPGLAETAHVLGQFSDTRPLSLRSTSNPKSPPENGSRAFHGTGCPAGSATAPANHVSKPEPADHALDRSPPGTIARATA